MKNPNSLGVGKSSNTIAVLLKKKKDTSEVERRNYIEKMRDLCGVLLFFVLCLFF